jgi:carboxyl-terminal processing protease
MHAPQPSSAPTPMLRAFRSGPSPLHNAFLPSRPQRWAITALTAGVLLALAACSGGDDDTADTVTGPVIVEAGLPDARLKGSWRVLGEGRLVEWTDQGIASFQQVKSLCYADPVRDKVATEFLEGARFRQVKKGGKVTLDVYFAPDAPSTLTLEQIPKIPDPCRQAPPQDPVTVFQALWDIFDLDYGFFAERHVDWPARYAEGRAKAAAATTDDELQAVLASALSVLDDYHVSLSRYQQDELTSWSSPANAPTLRLERQAFAQQSVVSSVGEFQAQWRHGMQQAVSRRLVGGSNGRVLNNSMVWGRLPGNVGYIELSQLSSFSDKETPASDLRLIRAEMDRAIAALADTRAIIVDIAVNDGGYDWVSAEVAGRFADTRRPAFSVQRHRSEGRPAEQWFVEPRGPRQYLKPVYLLTTDRTVSAGDTLTLMMRELPHVTHVGQPTSGSISDMLNKPLPGGRFAVSLSFESYFDPRGVLYEGRGIPPKLPLQVFDPADPATLFTGHEAAIDQLLALIAR